MSEPSDQQTGAARWRNWAGDEGCAPATMRAPGSVEELAAAVVEAGRRGLRVRVAGSGHSFSDIACTDGMSVSLRRLSRVLDVDRESGLVRVQAGITIRELSRQLAEHGLALENLGDIDVQTIAGAISTATHGTGARLRNISAQVCELTLVLADGSTLVCVRGRRCRGVPRRARGPRRARRDRRGHAALRARVHAARRGRARAAAGDARALRRAGARQRPLRVLRVPALRRRAHAHEQPHRARRRAPAAGSARTPTTSCSPTTPSSCSAARARRMPSRIPQLNRLVTRLAGSSKRVDSSAAIFATPRLVRFTEMEYALPREHTVQAVRRVMALIARRGFAVPFPIEVRTVAADDALLSTAAGRDSGFVAVHMYRGMEWEPYFRAVEAIMDELGGRPHWGKRHFQTAATLRARYPEWDRFQAVRARLDPRRPVRQRVDRSRARAAARAAVAMADDRYARLERATADLEAPFALVDLDALGANAADMERRAAGKPIRLASKSVRCRALQDRVLAREGFAGTLAFTLPEALWLVAHGASDIVVAYPTADRRALRALASDARRGGRGDGDGRRRRAARADRARHRRRGERARVPRRRRGLARARGPSARRREALAAAHAGAGRRARAGRSSARPRLRLVGIMAYEAQIAGVGDTPLWKPAAGARDPGDAGALRAGAGGPARGDRGGGAPGDRGRRRARARVRQRRRHGQPRAHHGASPPSRRWRRAPGSTAPPCSTPTAPSRRGPLRCSRCRSFAARAAAS